MPSLQLAVTLSTVTHLCRDRRPFLLELNLSGPGLGTQIEITQTSCSVATQNKGSHKSGHFKHIGGNAIKEKQVVL